MNNLVVVKALNDLAPDTESSGWIKQRSGPFQMMDSKAQDRTNLFPTLFGRWRTDRPEGWDINSNSWTKCGSGMGDTTAHASLFSAKFTTSAAMAISNYPIAATTVSQFAGKVINFSIWGKMPAGQTFTNYPLVYLSLTLPAWAGTHAYKVGECVADGGFVFQCLTAGTTGSSKPTFNATYEATYTDGGVIWKGMGYSFATNAATSFTAGDVGNWKRAVVGRDARPRPPA